MANNLDDIVTVATSTLATITPQSHRVDVILRIIELWYNDIMEEDWLEYYERQLTLGQELTDTKNQKYTPDQTMISAVPSRQ